MGPQSKDIVTFPEASEKIDDNNNSLDSKDVTMKVYLNFKVNSIKWLMNLQICYVRDPCQKTVLMLEKKQSINQSKENFQQSYQDPNIKESLYGAT